MRTVFACLLAFLMVFTASAPVFASSAGNGAILVGVQNTDSTITVSTASGVVTVSRPAITGDISIPSGSNAATLATVNTNVGSFTCANVTLNGKGLVTAAANGSCSGGSMVYPGAGIANSTGSAWGTSYSTTGTGTAIPLAAGASVSGWTITSSSINGVTPTTGGSATTYLNGAGAYTTPSGSGGNVNAGATLTANQIVIGSGTTNVAALGSLGTTTTLLHGNASGAPSFGSVALSTDISGFGANVATALATAVGSAGGPITNGGALGTPSSGTATNLTGLPIAGLTGLGSGVSSLLAGTSSGTGGIMGTVSPTTTGTMGAAAITATGQVQAANFSASGTGADTLPYGSSSQRPGSPANGMIRVNSNNSVEAYYNSTWNTFVSGLVNLATQVTGTLLPINGGSTGVAPEQYGAVGNGTINFDGAFSATNISATTNGTSTTPTTPAVTTVTANDVLVSVFFPESTWSSAPSVGTTRVNVAFVSSSWGIFASDQTISSAGATTPISGTASSSAFWQTASIPLAPSGGSVTFVAQTSFQSTATTGGHVTLTKPAGTTTGDYLVACTVSYQTGGQAGQIVPPTSTWTRIVSNVNGNFGENCWGKIAGASEPSSYQFTLTQSGSGAAAAMLDYRNTSGPDQSTSAFTSATGNFQAGAVGDPICIGRVTTTNASTFNKQICTTISAVNSTTSVTLPITMQSSFSSLEYAYGTDDTTAFQNMLTTAPCSTVGCEAKLGAKHYVLTGPLSIAANFAIRIKGISPGIPNTANNVSGLIPFQNSNNGTILHYLTQSLSGPALAFAGNSAGETSVTAIAGISDVTILGGDGLGSDGGNSSSAVNGMEITAWQNLVSQNTYVFNFSGYGAEVNKDGGYTENITLEQCYLSYNALGGLDYIGTQFNETGSVHRCIIEANGGPGVTLNSTGLYGFTLMDNTIQWNNSGIGYGSLNEIQVSGPVYGGLVEGNYFETGTLGNSVGIINNTANAIGIHVGSNFFNGTYTPLHFSAAGTALPSCASSQGATANTLTALVTDATNCQAGATYASGGSTTCEVTCTGGNWIENYAGGTASTGSETVGSSATPTFSVSYGTSYNVLTANVTSFTLAAGADGQEKTLCFKQGSGSYTVTAPANVHGFFTVGVTNADYNCQTFKYNAANSIWLATSAGVTNQ